MHIEIFTQSAIKLKGSKTIYFDPFKIPQSYKDADYIFITHDHYDHYDEESIKKIIKDDTLVIAPALMEARLKKLGVNTLSVTPNQSYELPDFKFKTTYAYNIHKPFHPKEKGYVGYLLELNQKTYYIMGDTDILEENANLNVDVCFIPIGGFYTADIYEASKYINSLKPKVVIPTHYGSIVGSITLGEEFQKLINSQIQVDIYIKEEK